LAARGGPEYYFGVDGTGGTFVLNEEKLQEVLRRLVGTRVVDFPYDRNQYAPARVPDPEPLPDGLDEHRNMTIVLSVAIGFGLLLIPFGLYRGYICAFGFIEALIFGVWLAVLRFRSPWHREYARRRLALNHARDDLHELEDGWGRTVRRYHRRHSELTEQVRGLAAECRELVSQYETELRRLSANAEANARLRHLRLHLLADSEIPNIGTGRKHVLASNGILTAADVDAHAIRGISGFGPVLTKSLLNWKEDVLRGFSFDPRTGVPTAERNASAVKFRTLQQQLLKVIEDRLGEIGGLVHSCQAELAKRIPVIKKAVASFDQADADMSLMSRYR
jgi:DNA-binding helix-hairpin-helix protein with protein kinase domain